MRPERLEAFTDGVIAIIITIMVLELRVPEHPTLAALRAELPLFLAYVLSFINVGLYWNNHHHMFRATEHIDGRVLWSNLFLLFWLSLVPFVIRWIGEEGITTLPAVAYGIVLGMAAIAYALTQRAIILCNGPDSNVAKAIGSDRKGKLSQMLYAFGILFAFISPWIAAGIYILNSAIWLIPDRRLERRLAGREN